MYPDEVPSLYLPRPSVCSRGTRRKPPRDRSAVLDAPTDDEMERDEVASQEGNNRDASTQTETNVAEELEMLRRKVLNLEKKLEEAENKLEEAKFTLSNIKDDDSKVTFYAVQRTNVADKELYHL